MEIQADVTDRFWEWAEEELEKRNLTWYAVERKSGVSTGAISKRVNYQPPTELTCRAIAEVFKIAPDIVFRRAGILPEPERYEPEMQDLIDTLKYLPDEELDRLMLFVEALYRYHKRETEEVPTALEGGGGERPNG
jgi:transcriptional regulator with XRE-family HTH domain